MKQLILLLALLTGLSAAAQEKKQDGKTPKTPEQKAEQMTKRMEKKLSLTPEQVTKVKAINLEAASQLHTLKEEAKKSGTKNKEARKAIRDEHDKKLSAVLTPEQMTEYRKLKEQRMAKMKEKKKDRK